LNGGLAMFKFEYPVFWCSNKRYSISKIQDWSVISPGGLMWIFLQILF